ncbi:MAG: twin-arginine translocase TatA/TatE family subunit [Chloroflexi bacterium]|nr:twin-arginine translocase TatA/TatE family subunit [Chloroflexota bacterium]
MPSLGAPEVAFVLVIVLLVFGAGKLPEVGRSVGRAITEFRQGVSGDERAAPGALPPAAPSPTSQ